MIIKNKNLSATILEYGATIQKLQFCGVNTVLGYETESEYKQNNDYLGAVIGRCANRIDGGIFKLNGSEYH
ncbi:MAG: galactose mutarotase, partial [Clostridia bacterium]